MTRPRVVASLACLATLAAGLVTWRSRAVGNDARQADSPPVFAAASEARARAPGASAGVATRPRLSHALVALAAASISQARANTAGDLAMADSPEGTADEGSPAVPPMRTPDDWLARAETTDDATVQRAMVARLLAFVRRQPPARRPALVRRIREIAERNPLHVDPNEDSGDEPNPAPPSQTTAPKE
jgi:hypothetical protein